MQITNVKIRRICQDNRLRALVSLTIDDEFAVHDIKVIQGPERLFIAMPSRRDENGVFRDIVHPISSKTRQMIEETILKEYFAHLEEMQKHEAEQPVQQEPAADPDYPEA